MKRLATALSLSRAVFFGPLIPAFAYYDHPVLAFGSLALGALTDGLDGWAARKGRPRGSANGGWMDPNCDAALMGWSLLGIMITYNWTFWLLVTFIFMIGLALLMKWLKTRRYRNRLTWFANFGLPLFEWGSFYVVGAMYLYYPYGQAMILPWLVASAIAIPIILRKKGYRINDWWNDRR